MKTVKNFKLLSVSLLLISSLAACDNPGSAEIAGKKLDDATNKAGMKIGETVSKVEDKLEEKNENAGIAIEDAEITTKVKSAIFSEPGLKTLRISVDTVRGEVTLTGSVDTQSDFDRTSALAKSVMGVKEVNNYLRITPPN